MLWITLGIQRNLLTHGANGCFVSFSQARTTGLAPGGIARGSREGSACATHSDKPSTPLQLKVAPLAGSLENRAEVHSKQRLPRLRDSSRIEGSSTREHGGIACDVARRLWKSTTEMAEACLHGEVGSADFIAGERRVTLR